MFDSDEEEPDDVVDDVGDVLRRGGGDLLFKFVANSSTLPLACSFPFGGAAECVSDKGGIPILALNMLLYEYVE